MFLNGGVMLVDRKDEYQRWLDKVNKTESCWLWEGTLNRKYGAFRRFINDKWVMYKAHRFAYEYFKGNIPQGLQVCHSCDNPKCVNPDHLWIGTAKENVADMLKKGRKNIGAKKTGTNLNQSIANQIRMVFNEGGKKYPEIAKMFNTSTAQVCRIINNKIWKE
jgi:hypothetical protein